jgi:hypothetical protein
MHAVGAGDSRLDTRLQAVSAGLRAVRVASAVRRRREGRPFTATDTTTINGVMQDLRNEIRVLRNEDMPDVTDETAFAFASLALSALPKTSEEKTDTRAAARQLEDLVREIGKLQLPGQPEEEPLAKLEKFFLRAGELAGAEVGRTGEKVDGQLERML